MTKKLMGISTLTFVCIMFVSCADDIMSDEPSEGNSMPVVDDASNDQPDPRPAYDGPPATFKVDTGASSTHFEWSVTVPTGGWSLQFKAATTNPRTGHAIIKAILTRPGPSEIVTQALETLTEEYNHGRHAYTTAELHITIRTRGEDTPDDYRVAAVWP